MEQADYVDLGHYWQILKRRFFPATLTFVTVTGALVVATHSTKTPTYVAEGQLLLKKKSTAVALTGDEGIGQLEPLSRESNPVVTEAAVIRSNSIIYKTIDRLKKEHSIALSAQALLGNLNIKTAKKAEQLADLIEVQYESVDPDAAALVVNTLMQTYLQEHIQGQRNDVVTARKFLEQKLTQATAKTQQAAQALQQFKSIYQVPLLQAQGQANVDLMKGGQQQIASLQAQLANTHAQAEALRSQLGMNSQQALQTTAVSQSTGVQDALKKLQDIEAQLAIERSRFQEENPAIIDLKTKAANLQHLLKGRVSEALQSDRATPNLQIGALQQELTAELAKLEARQFGLMNELSTLQATQRSYQQQSNSLPKLEQQQQALEQQAQDARNEYTRLLARYQESQIAENQNADNVRIVSAAVVPISPTSSNLIYYFASGLLGLLSAGVVVFLLEVSAKSIKTSDRAQQRFGFPVLGIIPEIHNASSSTLYYDLSNGFRRGVAHGQIEEAYRILRANLKSLHLGKSAGVMVLTSSVPREGTSTVCANLAMAMARIGHKTLLLDANLHNPTQHQIWKLSNEVGLSNVIQHHTDPKTVIQTVADHLDVLPAGIDVECPADLIDSGRMATLVETLSREYDFVLIDAPALTTAADALVLGQMASGVLLTVKPGVVDTKSAALAKSSLEQSNQKILGIVVNGDSASSLPLTANRMEPTIGVTPD